MDSPRPAPLPRRRDRPCGVVGEEDDGCVSAAHSSPAVLGLISVTTRPLNRTCTRAGSTEMTSAPAKRSPTAADFDQAVRSSQQRQGMADRAHERERHRVGVGRRNRRRGLGWLEISSDCGKISQ